MTLIASYWEHDWPVLVGDLLLSTKVKPKGSYHIPTKGYSDDLYKNKLGYKNAGLGRKIHKFSDQLAMGWTGHELAAKTVFSDVEEKLTGKLISRSDLLNFFENIDYLASLDLSIVGLFTGLDGTITFKWNSDSTTIDIGGNYAEGSGADYFKSFFKDFSSVDTSPIPEGSSAVTEALRKCILMIGDELINESTYQDFFGGGFELITHQDGGLKIVSDFAIVPWVVNYENFRIKEIYFKKNILQQRYDENILWISSSSFRAKEIDSRYQDKWRTELYALDSVHGKETNDSISRIEFCDFHSKTICQYFHINLQDENKILTIVDIAFNAKTDLIEFVSSKSGIQLTLSDEYIETISKVIEANVKENDNDNSTIN